MFEQYSGDEAFALVVSVVLSLITWGLWLRDALFVMRPWAKHSHRAALLLMPLFCAVLLFVVLKNLAASDVREAPAYVIFYLILGAAWLGVSHCFLPGFGLSPRDDVIERGNAAAAFAVSGALIGITCCFAGANIGDGPGWWVVLFTGTLATGTLAGLWLAFASITRAADAITIERDTSAGVRAAGLLIGAGMILGRAAAGNWVSVERTLLDFARVGWPVCLLLGLGIALERQFPPRLERDPIVILVRGGVAAATYLLAGAAVIVLAGPW